MRGRLSLAPTLAGRQAITHLDLGPRCLLLYSLWPYAEAHSTCHLA